MSITSLTTVAAETHAEASVNPWVVGVVTLAILLALLLALLSFGRGREHA